MANNKEKNSVGVFRGVLGMDSTKNTVDHFIMEGLKSKDPRMVKEVESYKKEYDKIEKSLKRLANKELLILQIRAMNTVTDTLTYYLLHDNFIYARAVFKRPDKKKNDIRVLVDQVKNHPKSNYDAIVKTRRLKNLAVEKLKEAMEKQIEITLENI